MDVRVKRAYLNEIESAHEGCTELLKLGGAISYVHQEASQSLGIEGSEGVALAWKRERRMQNELVYQM